MSEEIQTTVERQVHTPQSPEVDEEEIKRLIRDVVVQKPAKLHFPKSEE